MEYAHVMTPTCPRCGYDQSGLVATWRTECPLVGVCPECGLESRWRDVLNPSFQNRRGFVEHADSFWKFVRWTVITYVWIALPWVFWRRVQMHYRTRPRRLVLFLVMTLAVPWFVSAIAHTSYVLVIDRNGETMGAGMSAWHYVNAWSSPLFTHTDARFAGGNRLRWFWQFLPSPWLTGTALGIAFPLLLIVVAQTRNKHKLRLQHVVRAGIYGAVWFVPLFWFRVYEVAVGLAAAVEYLVMNRGIGNTWVDVLGLYDFVIFVYDHQIAQCVLLLVWQLLWWWSFMKFYARFDNPTRSFVILAIPAVLIAFLAFTISDIYGVGPSIW